MATPVNIEGALSTAENLTEKADQVAAKLEGRDRSAIAKRVILLYIGAVVACFAFIIGVFWFLTPCTTTPGAATTAAACVEWQGPADFLLQVLTTAVLPIVTLVLGYYFGTAKADTE